MNRELFHTLQYAFQNICITFKTFTTYFTCTIFISIPDRRSSLNTCLSSLSNLLDIVSVLSRQQLAQFFMTDNRGTSHRIGE